MFSFLWPFVACVLPLPWILRHILKPAPTTQNTQEAYAIYVPFFNRLNEIKSAHVQKSKNNFPKTPLILAWCFLVLACMRPTWLGEAIPVNQAAHNIILTMDVSGSMGEQDFSMNLMPLTRLEMLQRISQDFIKTRTGDNLGLIIFGSEAYTYAPLSPDTKTLKELINEIGVGIAGTQTAIGEALALAIQTGRTVPADKQIIILMSDGYNNAGKVSIKEAIDLAKNQNIKIYTVGIGSDAKMVKNFFGTFQVNPALDLDEKTLTTIAQETGGKYFRAKTSEEMKDIYETINKMEPVMRPTEFIRPQKGLFYWPLAASLFLFGWCFRHLRRQR